MTTTQDTGSEFSDIASHTDKEAIVSEALQDGVCVCMRPCACVCASSLHHNPCFTAINAGSPGLPTRQDVMQENQK